MVDLEGYAEFDGGAGGQSDDDDDIARFERQCAERARAEGLDVDPVDDEACSDEEDDQKRNVRLVTGTGAPPASDDEWRRKCELLQDKLARRETDLSQARAELDLLRSEGLGPNDPQTELTQRLLDLTKKNRRLQVTTESQKARLQQLEAEVQKPKEQAKRMAEEIAMQNAAALMGDGGNVEDWKKKYLAAANQLQQARHEGQEMRSQAQKQKKVLIKELGSEENLDKALSAMDDPNAIQWKGRAAQIAQLQRQVKELKASTGGTAVAETAPDPIPAPVAATAPTPAATKALAQAAEKRREEFEKLQEETERLRTDAADARKKRDAMKSRTSHLESQLRELKAHVQFLLQKSDDDDGLVDALRRQLGRSEEQAGSSADCSGGAARKLEQLRQEKGELQTQLERQAQIVLQLRQKTQAALGENDSMPLRPKSTESSTNERELVERIRHLEAENSKQSEQVRLLQDQTGITLKRLGAGSPEFPDSSPRSRPSSRASSIGVAGPDTEQALRQNEALKREIVRLRSQIGARGNA
eukprot:TRINITY_DN20618_c0_g1_i1.p1 TRINITY_DN20618_c0_g1~~TRINITY_DN20618_c0_g1_i1.p1  ORF type:complete len:530 (-),score=157.20 TRINITY_DN20618_c0_g1_i1:399-1988(-)